MAMAKFVTGERVYVTETRGSYFSAEVIMVRKTILGNYKYLLHYTVHDIDSDYTYKSLKWFSEGRLFTWNI